MFAGGNGPVVKETGCYGRRREKRVVSCWRGPRTSPGRGFRERSVHHGERAGRSLGKHAAQWVGALQEAWKNGVDTERQWAVPSDEMRFKAGGCWEREGEWSGRGSKEQGRT